MVGSDCEITPDHTIKRNKKKVWYGISAASGLPKLWIAGWNDSGLDNGGNGIDQ
jgi:hypothetical protein